MLYDAYEFQKSWLSGASIMANLGVDWMQNPANPLSHTSLGPMIASGLDVFAHASQARGKPRFGFESTTLKDGRTVAVSEEIVLRKPFGQLKRFRRESVEGGPKLLIVAPMSGHYA
ncbi:MAG: polyhydroxyalkanoate depolymerase, partial [Sphingomonas bacterium]|nr:polyhydroxyalkanoate depolymerase [Sphingomonas bacterium]